MDTADSNSLQQFAAAVRQYSGFANDNDEVSSHQDAISAGATGYAPIESLNANQSPSYSLNSANVSPNVQTRRMRNTSNTTATSTMRSPQQTRSGTMQTRSSQTPSRNGSIITSTTTPQMQSGGFADPNSSVPAQKQNGFVFKNASSAFPNGSTPAPRSQSQSSQTQIYTTPRGPVHSDPWSSHYKSGSTPEGLNRASVNIEDPVEVDPAVAANPFSDTFPLITDPPNLEEWRERLFNVGETLVLSEEDFLTYFPHVDNVYSHRSTQKYKRKAFVSHYWDCRLKGRPSGTPKSDDPNKKKRKRTARGRDLCDVKIKITEYFSAEEARKLGLEGNGAITADSNSGGGMINDMSMYSGADNSTLNMVMNDGSHSLGANLNGLGGGLIGSVIPPSSSTSADPNFGMLELPRPLPQGHPGINGKRWFTIQRVRGNPGGGAVRDNNKRDGTANGDGDEEADQSVLDPNLAGDLDHKHTLEESDRIKKNTVQRWILKGEKEKKRISKAPVVNESTDLATSSKESVSPTFRASGMAYFTVRSHAAPAPTKMTFYANSFCPFAQRIWMALEIKGIPYQMVEVLPANLDTYRPPDMLEVNPEGHIPSVRHGNWGIWESGVVLEYLEDLAMGHALMPLGNPQLRAHCRLWTDHINRKILPSFYSLLLTPPPSPTGEAPMDMDEMDLDGGDNAQMAAAANTAQHTMLVATLQKNITALVNASHATGPFFLGTEIGFVDVAFAPWIIRLSRVLSYYRNFPRPEVGTRWRQWVDAIETDERVKGTVSDENSYHGVYRGVGEDGWAAKDAHKPMVEIHYARKIVAQEGFGLGGDVWGRLPEEDAVHNPGSVPLTT